MAEREFLVPGSTPVRAIRAVWDPDRPHSQIRIETAARLSVNDIDRRMVVVLPRELKWIYENTVGKQPKPQLTVVRQEAPSEPPQVQPLVQERKKPGPKPKAV